MIRLNKMLVAGGLAAALAAGFAAPIVLAQPAPGGPPPRERPHTQRMESHGLPSERVEASLAYAKTRLKITAAQEANWNAVADVVRKQAAAMDEHVKQMRAQPRPAKADRPTGIEQLERRQSMMAAGAQRMAEGARTMADVVNAAKPLYASFSDEQKKVADEMLSRMGGRHGMMGGGMGGPMGGHRGPMRH